jgi:phosphohistidine phosphatase
MDLILWRHAEAEELREGLDDLERALTPKGVRQAQRMAEWLDRQLPHGTRVLVSPARRTQETARALNRPFRTLPQLGPQAEPEALIQASRWPASTEPVLVVGHQPTLGLLAAQLLTGTAQPWSVRKGAVWWLRTRVREEKLQVVLMASLGPELL